MTRNKSGKSGISILFILLVVLALFWGRHDAKGAEPSAPQVTHAITYTAQTKHCPGACALDSVHVVSPDRPIREVCGQLTLEARIAGLWQGVGNGSICSWLRTGVTDTVIPVRLRVTRQQFRRSAQYPLRLVGETNQSDAESVRRVRLPVVHRIEQSPQYVSGSSACRGLCAQYSVHATDIRPLPGVCLQLILQARVRGRWRFIDGRGICGDQSGDIFKTSASLELRVSRRLIRRYHDNALRLVGFTNLTRDKLYVRVPPCLE